MPSHPLTHHEILTWIGPFTRCGRQVDLASSDRIVRRLLFKPISHEAAEGEGNPVPASRETLQLESLPDGLFRLTRVLTSASGLTAQLHTEGLQPGELLARIDAVPIPSQLQSGQGFEIAYSHRSGIDAPALVLTHSVARIGPLTLALDPPTIRGVLADLTLTGLAHEAIDLPDDLFAVLGRDWSRLGEAAVGWRSSLRLRGGELARSRDAEAKLMQAAAHVARCLAEPPARFHERQRAARWWVYARRSLPLLACIALLLAAASVPKLNLADNSPWRMLIFNAPPLLLILVFCLRELPRIEIPPWPRRATAAAWQTPPISSEEPCSPTR